MIEDRKAGLRTEDDLAAGRSFLDRLFRLVTADEHRRARELATFVYLTAVTVASITATLISIVRTYSGAADAVLIVVLLLCDFVAIGGAAVGWVLAPRRPRRNRR